MVAAARFADLLFLSRRKPPRVPRSLGRRAVALGAGLGLVVLVAAGAGEPAAEPVALNHFFAVLDPDTFRAIKDSDFLRQEFAAMEERTTVRTDLTYTGLYFYGTETYFEFLDAAQDRSRHEGDSGVGFGVDRPGGLQRLAARAAAERPMARWPVTREYQGHQVPWFAMIVPKDLDEHAAFTSWVMEYEPTFLSAWHAPAAGGERGITRREVLARYAAVLPTRPAHPLFRDVTGLTLAVSPAGRELLVNQSRLFGHLVRQEGPATVIEMPGTVLRLVPVESGRPGVRAITLAVHDRPGPLRDLRLGPRSRLVFKGDGTAEWTF